MTTSAGRRRTLPTSPFAAAAAAAPELQLVTGDRVCHDRHGLGTVMREATEQDRTAVVAFRDAGTYRVALNSPRLSKL